MPLDPASDELQHVGFLTEQTVAVLKLSLTPGPIHMGKSNFEHILSRHPEMYLSHLDDIPLVISRPDCIGVNPNQGGVEFIKRLDGNLMVAVRASSSGVLYARSIYRVEERKLRQYLKDGRFLVYTDGNP